MTFRLLDVASYQGSLWPADVARAGFAAVNLKTSHGLGQTGVHPDVTGWVAAARSLHLGIGTFHWLIAGDGAAQAEYAYARLRALGIEDGTAHTVDTESDATWSTISAYATRMTELLGRPIALYTGDWWWQAAGRNWRGSDLTPYLWAAPNAGYLAAYPGDASSHWAAGYGGWPTLSVMQYAVAPLSTDSAIKVSKSAIRDPTVWTALTLGRPGMTFAPNTLLAARKVYIGGLARAGYTIDPVSVGIVGDDNHTQTGSSYHLGKSALRPDSYTIVESSRDRTGLSEAASALDLGWFKISVGGKSHDLRSLSVWLVAQCKAGTPDTRDIREIIYSADGSTVKRWDRLGIRTTGDSSHLSHTHLSRFRDAENSGTFVTLLTRYFTEIGALEVDMDAAQTTAWARSADGKAALVAALREAFPLGLYDVLWSAANGVDVGNPVRVPWDSVGRPIRDNLRTVVGGPVDQDTLVAAIRASDTPAEDIAAAIVAAMPGEQADAIVDALVARIRQGTGTPPVSG